jgi:lipoprotein LpqS
MCASELCSAARRLEMRSYAVDARDRSAITTMLQLGGSRLMLPRAATVGNIVRYNDGHTRTRLRNGIALGVAILVFVISAEWTLPWSDSPAVYAPHALAAAPSAELAIVADHPHMQDGSKPIPPDTLTAMVAPRVTTVLIAMGLIAVVTMLAFSWGSASLAPVRGPPRALAGVLAGQQILTRFCIARC